MQTRPEGNRSFVRVHLDVTQGLVKVGGDDDVDGLDGPRERLVQILLGHLELEQSTVDLVDDDDGLDTLAQGLTEHGLGLDAHAFDGVDDDQGAVGDTQGGRDLGREVDVTGRVDQVDEEIPAVRLLTDDVLKIIVILQIAV